MKAFLKNLGLILIILGTVILIACSVTGNVNNNAILLTAAALVVGGVISYIVINKRITDSARKAIRNKKSRNMFRLFLFLIALYFTIGSNKLISLTVDIYNLN